MHELHVHNLQRMFDQQHLQHPTLTSGCCLAERPCSGAAVWRQLLLQLLQCTAECTCTTTSTQRRQRQQLLLLLTVRVLHNCWVVLLVLLLRCLCCPQS